jgi:hypothetical protein
MSPWPRLFRHRPPRELPTYRALAWTATQALPEALLRREEEVRATSGDRHVKRLESVPCRPADDEPLYTALVTGTPPHIGFATAQAAEGPCWLTFTTPLRAAHYRDQVPSDTTSRDVGYLELTAIEFVRALELARDAGIARFVVDPCAYCPHGLAVAGDDLRRPLDAIAIWAMATAQIELRTHVFMRYALDAAGAARFEEARDVALCAVAHVTADEPHLHLLIGQLGVALGAPSLVREARRCLQFLGRDALASALDDAMRARVPDFSTVHVPG